MVVKIYPKLQLWLDAVLKQNVSEKRFNLKHSWIFLFQVYFLYLVVTFINKSSQRDELIELYDDYPAIAVEKYC